MGVVRDVRERFWSKVNKDGPTPPHRPDLGPCWVWTTGLDTSGYGQFWANGRNGQAHRWAVTLTYGEIPPERTIDHLCFRHECVNPDHLEVVSLEVNRRRQALAHAVGTRLCKVPGCDGLHSGRGLCQVHHRRWRAAGRPDQAVWIAAMLAKVAQSDQGEFEMVGGR